MKIESSPCTDRAIMILAATAAGALCGQCKTAIVVLTSECPDENHANHVTCAVVNSVGTMTPSETRAACKRLRELADELEQQFAPEGSSN